MVAIIILFKGNECVLMSVTGKFVFSQKRGVKIPADYCEYKLISSEAEVLLNKGNYFVKISEKTLDFD